MGAQSSLLGLVGTAAIGANKAAEGISQASKKGKNNVKNPLDDGIKRGFSVQVAQAVDADRAEMARLTAEYNKEKLKNMKLRNKKLRMQNKALKEKQTLKKDEDKVVRLPPQHGNESLKGPFQGGDK